MSTLFQVIGRADIQSAFEARPSKRITRHLCTNIVITALSSTEASGKLYALVFTGDADNRGDLGVIVDQRQLVGEFQDDYVCTDEGWRIANHSGRIIFSSD